jgi:hypothetical protein
MIGTCLDLIGNYAARCRGGEILPGAAAAVVAEFSEAGFILVSIAHCFRKNSRTDG